MNDLKGRTAVRTGAASGEQVQAPVLCPSFVPNGIKSSGRNWPASLQGEALPAQAQLIGQAMTAKAVFSGKVSAADVAGRVFAALRDGRCCFFSHPQALGGVQTRLEHVMQGRNPTDPFRERPAVPAQLRAALRAV